MYTGVHILIIKKYVPGIDGVLMGVFSCWHVLLHFDWAGIIPLAVRNLHVEFF